jgi:hypothetical protein
MTTYQNLVNDPSAAVSLGSPSLSAGDTIQFIKFSIAYTAGGDFSATDLLLAEIGSECECDFQAALGGQLKLTCNRTSTGQFINRSRRSRRIDLFSTSSTGVIYKIIQAGMGPLYLGTLKCAGGLWCIGIGRVYIAGDVDVTTISVDKDGRCTYYKTSGAFAATTINNRGEILIQNDYATLNNYSGTATHDDPSITPVQINGLGGTILMKDCGTIGGMTLENTVIDWSQMKGPITVSGTTSIGAGCTIRYAKGGYEPTWTPSYPSTKPVIEYV